MDEGSGFTVQDVILMVQDAGGGPVVGRRVDPPGVRHGPVSFSRVRV